MRVRPRMASGGPRRLTRAESAPLLRSFDHPLLHVGRRRRGLRRAHRPGDPRPALLRARSRNVHAPRPARGGDAADRAARAKARRRRRSVDWRKAARSRTNVIDASCHNSADRHGGLLACTSGRSCSARRCAIPARPTARHAQAVVRTAGRGPAAVRTACRRTSWSRGAAAQRRDPRRPSRATGGRPRRFRARPR